MRFIFTILTFIAVTNLSAQSVYSVNNNPGALADYTSFQTALDSASAGDILMVHGSAINYGSFVISKPIVIVGPGYFLTQNPETQVSHASAIFSALKFISGSEGSIVTGLEVTGTTSNTYGDAGIYISGASNIVISRNYILGISSYALRIETASNVQVNQNYIINNYTAYQCIYINNSSSIFIKNNYVEGGYRSLNIGSTGGAIFTNNILKTRYTAAFNSTNLLDVTNSTFYNNIIINHSSPNGSNYFAQNNIYTSQYGFGTSNGNQQSVSEDTLFVGFPSSTGFSTDGKWKLDVASPAIGAGLNGIDCGIFGGTEPYKLSGIPFVPNIYELTVPNTGTSGGGLDVHIKARANN
jgi:hypothetical protein